MNIESLIIEIVRLYDFYDVDKSTFADLHKNQVAKQAKGILATLDLGKKENYTQSDKEMIKKIYYFFC